MSEYLTAGKETNTPILARLYSDIGDEERFHLEQLMYAKSTITGEKYMPRDPEVKAEYEELLAQGMDEETAMCTAIDKRGIMSTNDDDDDDESIDDMLDDIEILEQTIDLHIKNFVLETTLIHKGQDIESIYQESMYNGYDNNGSSNVHVFRMIGNFISTIGNLIKKLLNFIKSNISNVYKRHKEIKRFIANNGLSGLFKEGLKLYVYTDGQGSVRNCFDKTFKQVQGFIYDLLNMMCSVEQDIGVKITYNFKYFDKPKRDKLMPAMKNSKFHKTKIVLNDNNRDEIAKIFFDPDYKNESPYLKLTKLLNQVNPLVLNRKEILKEFEKLQSNTQSLYYRDKQKFNSLIDEFKQIMNIIAMFVKCIGADVKTLFEFSKKVSDAATDGLNNIPQNQ